MLFVFLKVPILCQLPAFYCSMLVISVADWQHLLYSGYVFKIHVLQLSLNQPINQLISDYSL